MTIQRKTRIPRKRARKRAYKTPRCVSRGCRQPQKHLSRCRKHAHAYLDGLWRMREDGQRCELADLHEQEGFACAGVTQACHGIDRDEGPARWSPLNRFWGCAGANYWGSIHRRRWYAYVRRSLGEAVYDEMADACDRAARSGWEPDYPEIERVLRADLERRGLASPRSEVPQASEPSTS